MNNLCVRCDRPTPDGYACSGCAYRAGDQLHDIADMTPAARDIAHGFAHRGTGGSSGKPGSRLPFDLGATAKLDAVQSRLSTWVGEIAHGRSRPIPAPRHLGDDPIVLWARWLAGHVEWIRHTDDAERFLIEVDECARVVRGLARGPAEQKYLGPCGATLTMGCEVCEQEIAVGDAYATVPGTGGLVQCGPHALHLGELRVRQTDICDGDVYASRGSRTGRCRVCGAEVSTDERAAWLDGQARSHAFRAAQIAEAYRVNVNTIRSWAARGQLVPHGHDAEDRPLFNVGDVLDLAAADAARRATEQAKRARRAAAKAAETEDAA